MTLLGRMQRFVPEFAKHWQRYARRVALPGGLGKKRRSARGIVNLFALMGLAQGFAPWQPLLPLAAWLVGVLHPVIERAVLTMFHSWEDLPLSGFIVLVFVSDDDSRHIGQTLEQLTNEPLCGPLVPAALHQAIQETLST
jgi:hypothetical protein